MLKKILFSLLIAVSFIGLSQEEERKSSWSTEVSYLDNGNVKVKVIAHLIDSFHIYSLYSPGGFPTSIDFDENSGNYELTEIISEPKPVTKYEEVFEVDIKFHDTHEVIFEQLLEVKSKEDFDLTVSIKTQACKDGVACYLEPVKLKVSIEVGSVKEESIFWLFIVGFGAGLLALLTPCVFPMIPMTVTYFTKMAESRSKGIRQAFIYGISIIVIYVALGFGVSAIVNDEAIYLMASSISFNIAFFLVFTIFAISFLGAFEITLPSSWSNKMDAKADKGGLLGVFFMAFTLALVSFSCTGPVIGSLIIEAAVEGGVKGPLMGMLGFGVALALPFTLFAIFPSGLNKLPKSGGWLNSVKVVLGLLELALALKFLSNADLVVQSEYITREIFIAAWVVIFTVMGFYLLGKIRLPHDSVIEKLSVTRLLLGITTLIFVVYMIPGMFGAPLKILSGILPPSFYTEGTWYGPFKGSKSQSTYLTSIAGTKQAHECPNELDCYHDYDEALKVAKEAGKPLMIDFTGWTCTNCRKMEQNVWGDKAIDNLIRNEYILVSLYADDRTELTEGDKYISKRNGEEITTLGGKVRDFQISTFGKLAMPLYVLVDHEENKLVPVKGFDLNIDSYQNFLEVGLMKFKKQAPILVNKNK
jgi:thiol:disulfide interchange protein DsbD